MKLLKAKLIEEQAREYAGHDTRMGIVLPDNYDGNDFFLIYTTVLLVGDKFCLQWCKPIEERKKDDTDTFYEIPSNI